VLAVRVQVICRLMHGWVTTGVYTGLQAFAALEDGEFLQERFTSNVDVGVPRQKLAYLDTA
jgi:hypothetical protein